MIVYNRVNALDNQGEQNIVALSVFLGCAWLAETNVIITSQVFMSASVPSAQAWEGSKFIIFFPALKPEDTANGNPTSNSSNKPNAVLMAALLKLLNLQASSAAIFTVSAMEIEDNFGMFRRELDMMLKSSAD